MKSTIPKIAIFVYSMAGGGAERVVSYLLPYLIEKGYTVHLILMNTRINYPIPDDVPVHYIEKSDAQEHGIFKFLKLPLLAFKYARILKKLKITHSFSLLTRPNYINIMSMLFTTYRYKVTISERSHPSLQYGYKNLQSKINNFLIRTVYPNADHIICNSQGNADDLIDNYAIDLDLLDVINNPIDLAAIEKIKPISGFFDDNYFNIITVGRLDSGKNHELLINVIKGQKSARLYILGDGPLKSYLNNMVIENSLEDCVFLLGFDSNPFKYLKSADLFMFGSNHEGFPNVLIEAMSCGLPLLTTNCKSGPDEIMKLEEAKEDDIMITPYGILTPVGHLEAMKKGLSYFLEHPEYLESCRSKVLERARDFEKDHILESYMNEILA